MWVLARVHVAVVGRTTSAAMRAFFSASSRWRTSVALHTQQGTVEPHHVHRDTETSSQNACQLRLGLAL